ncbi:bifunctional 2-keto-4-hydroxyglutarate aldolase/2-keto-3-deoxy-6-phosphogluconate aldolase [Paenibacillus macquariensis]|uniref:2-keto-3-deoxy-phosphogluconate aldolase n=1 Tax=Paenibacillus macquariensis TaxID=948756 RepID=A0ABY1JL56_9BACL|nr:bifunctional 2-keto-4-hydroxyglutarate aldolase/2-keto-3-deoxy-6-phosphogluconate aldolase [Paenibacillus macquariensis]MEC0090004.1 bifunctional 2-keto-4-hydroxyglutarate aldolase/2-keto-3-deoxy-6-phosphogluconate aldolase [Paenibacillus macquariensis]OAB31111.1 bifunctional 2-keto-4-hydroxyglutarate aldolase/2-keto-3-deoxy-6-phosphogluconate aldolase [Paenibacillus macquariensis subsp. macquariensis]SIQ35923.1 2-keto-3-deoxy-phosphogluconate aldolase [Paenibacillus macquariensis]
MQKIRVLQNISSVGVVAVIRADTAEAAVRMSESCIEGGLNNIEVTFTTPDADQAIKSLAKKYGDKAVIGAGTVLDPLTARIAILAGAEFIVSPSFEEETAKMCNLYGIPYMPGCLTLNEMKEALKLGVDVLKLFPGSAFGPDYIKAVKGPMPHVNIMPTGGVDLNNMEQWIRNGCIAVGIGGNLTAPAKDDRYDLITELAAQYVAKFQEIITSNK